MHDSGHTESVHDAPTTNDRISTTPLPCYFNEWGYTFYVPGGRENPQIAGKARTPYKMNAQRL